MFPDSLSNVTANQATQYEKSTMLIINAPANPQPGFRSKWCAVLSDAVIIAKGVALSNAQCRMTLVVSGVIIVEISDFASCLYADWIIAICV